MGEVGFRCHFAEFGDFDHAEQTQVLPGTDGHGGYIAGRSLSQPYEGLTDVMGDVPQAVTCVTLPTHEMNCEEVSESIPPMAQSGTLRVAIDSNTHHVTHLVLKQNHVLGRK
jgi:hypothetical protein